MGLLIKRGTVCWVDLNPTKGSEISKIRPAVIISNDVNNEFADTVTILPITKGTSRIYPFEVLVPEGILKEASKVKANQISTIDKKRINSIITSLPSSCIIEIEKAVKIHLGLL